ncbi:MAG: hypothetical protein HY619_06055, partial [Thaumarchaeota archaeon]|nr:hypothetical protein [Nitrososphaerota archaeon]
VSKVECSKLSEKNEENTEVAFNVNASLAESERNPQWLTVKFELNVETQPSVGKLSLAGSATIKGDGEEVQALITPKDSNSVPPVFMKIYHKLYPVIYLLCGTLKIPYPSPGLLKATYVGSPVEQKNV